MKKIKKRYIALIISLSVIAGLGIFVLRPRGEVNTSFSYRAFYTFFQILQTTEKKETSDTQPEAKQNDQPTSSAAPGKKFQNKFTVTENKAAGLSYYTVTPKTAVGEKTILYLHGGAYVHEISSFQWNLIGKLVDHTNSRVIVPIYPLAGVQSYEKTFPMLLTLYQTLLPTMNPDELVLMGDSAGGGMSLAFAQLLKQKELPQPHDIVLFSPWLDASMTNPKIQDYTAVDPVLTVPGLLKAANMYAGSADLKEPLISPIYGDLTGLGHITMYAGTYELFLPDARQLAANAKEQNISLTYHEVPEMIHAWIIFPMREADEAIEQLVKEVF